MSCNNYNNLTISIPYPNNYNMYSSNKFILDSMLQDQRDHLFSKFSDTYLKYRKVVIEWMLGVCDYFHLHITTSHAAAYYLDRLQPNEKFSRSEWQMIAICCILISAKYNECEEHVPDRETLQEITQQPISNETILYYELWALKVMGWRLNVRSPIAFLTTLENIGLTTSKDICSTIPDIIHRKEIISNELQTIVTTVLLNDQLKSFKAIHAACAIIAVIRRKLNIKPIWNKELEILTSCNLNITEISIFITNLQKILHLPIENLCLESLCNDSAPDSPISVAQLDALEAVDDVSTFKTINKKSTSNVTEEDELIINAISNLVL